MGRRPTSCSTLAWPPWKRCRLWRSTKKSNDRMEERLQKLMSRAGFGSRRASEDIIRAGRVRVNGRVATLGDKADPKVDRVTVDGEPLTFEERIYIMLNKPRGVLSSTEDDLEEGRPTVTGLVDVD